MKANLTDLDQKNFKYAFIFAFLPFSIAFILSCLFRTMNAVLVPTLEKLIHVTPEQLGALNATFFLAYAIFQIPLGTLLDYFGARKTQSVLFVVGGIGLIISGFTTNILIISLGHTLIGIGMSGGLMAAFKLIVQWFPREKIPMLNGLMMTSGGIGLLLSTTPTEFLVSHYGWSYLNIGFGLAAFLSAAIVFFFVPENHTAIEKLAFTQQVRSIFLAFQSLYFWRITAITASTLGSFMAIHALWVEGWLSHISHLNQSTINNYLIVMALSMTASLFLTGPIAKIANYYKYPQENLLGSLFIIYIIMELSLIFVRSSYDLVFWVLVSFISQIFNLSYALLTQRYSHTSSGRTTTALNVIVFLSAFTIQYAIGEMITILMKNHSTLESYQISFLIPVFIQIGAALFFYCSAKKKADYIEVPLK